VTVLTSVGLEHTRWLGPTLSDIASEKLAVLASDTTLALGSGLDPEVLLIAADVAQRQRAKIVTGTDQTFAEKTVSQSELPLGAQGLFQRQNCALAVSACEAYLTETGIEVRQDAIADAALATVVPGRFEVVGESPLTIFDGAHNADAMVALTESLTKLFHDRPLVAVLGVLDDKDAVGMLRTLLPLCQRVWVTAPPSSRALSPSALQSLARQLGFSEVQCEPKPARALAAAQTWATDHSDGAVVLVTGSIYLIGELKHLMDDVRATTQSLGHSQK
jgi:dihydrofolate synthase/folylpolyglutamate synthase